MTSLKTGQSLSGPLLENSGQSPYEEGKYWSGTAQVFPHSEQVTQEIPQSSFIVDRTNSPILLGSASLLSIGLCPGMGILWQTISRLEATAIFSNSTYLFLVRNTNYSVASATSSRTAQAREWPKCPRSGKRQRVLWDRPKYLMARATAQRCVGQYGTADSELTVAIRRGSVRVWSWGLAVAILRLLLTAALLFTGQGKKIRHKSPQDIVIELHWWYGTVAAETGRSGVSEDGFGCGGWRREFPPCR